MYFVSGTIGGNSLDYAHATIGCFALCTLATTAASTRELIKWCDELFLTWAFQLLFLIVQCLFFNYQIHA